MAFVEINIENVTVSADEELLKAITLKIDELLKDKIDQAVVAKAATDLDKSTDDLQQAIDKNS